MGAANISSTANPASFAVGLIPSIVPLYANYVSIAILADRNANRSRRRHRSSNDSNGFSRNSAAKLGTERCSHVPGGDEAAMDRGDLNGLKSNNVNHRHM